MRPYGIHKKAFLTSLAIALIPAFVGNFAARTSLRTWYPQLRQAPFTPPNWIFGPIWTILYLLQGFSLYLIYRTRADHTKKLIAYLFFGSQLLLNLSWTVIFFQLHHLRVAFVEIGLLIIILILSIVSAYRVSKKAGLLLVPYLAWISYAAYLNFWLAKLNR